MLSEDRFYKIADQQYPSVTTILKIISKPGLMVWLAKQQEQSIKDITEKALDIGSQAHAGIAALTQRFLGKSIEIPPVVDDALIAIHAWDEWVERESIKFLDSEVLVWCEECQYAGTLDFVATTTGSVKTPDKTPDKTAIDCIKALLPNKLPLTTEKSSTCGNELGLCTDKSDNLDALRVGESGGQESSIFFNYHPIIGDYKTSKALYRDYELQVVAYAHAWLVRHGLSHTEAMNPSRFVSLCLIRLPKSHPKEHIHRGCTEGCTEKNASNGIEIKYLDSPPAVPLFLAARDLWRFMKNA